MTRTSATGTCDRVQRGFTLVEVLVVVAIVATLVAALAIALPQFDQRRAEREAERLAALLTLVCEQAELSGRDLGLHLSRHGYAFSLADREEWLPFGPAHRFHPRQVEGVALRLAGRELPTELPERPDPDAVCWPSGELSELEVRFVHSGPEQARVVSGADARSHVEVSPDGRHWRGLR